MQCTLWTGHRSTSLALHMLFPTIKSVIYNFWNKSVEMTYCFWMYWKWMEFRELRETLFIYEYFNLIDFYSPTFSSNYKTKSSFLKKNKYWYSQTELSAVLCSNEWDILYTGQTKLPTLGYIPTTIFPSIRKHLTLDWKINFEFIQNSVETG